MASSEEGKTALEEQEQGPQPQATAAAPARDEQASAQGPIILEAGSYRPEIYRQLAAGRGSVVFVRRRQPGSAYPWRRIIAPLAVLVAALLVMVAVLSFGLGSTLASGGGATSSASSDQSATMSGMSNMNTGSQDADATATVAALPRATQSQGNQLATYVRDPDGAKHFTLTAEQVLWEVVKGTWVPAYTINGTVPGPMIRVAAGDHVRITVINHFHEATSIHWHGLEVPSQQDGVPGLGQQPIQPGQRYVYDFTVHDQDVGTHWYHSHYNDLNEVAGGCYGAFIVDPRPGSPQARVEVHADVDYTAFIGTLPGGYYVINGKSFPDTQPLHVRHGQTVRLRLIGADTLGIHPMHLHGHIFTVVAQDGHPLSQPYQRDTLQVAPGETYDLVFTAWAAPGSSYPFHCHILSHLMNPGQNESEMGGLVMLVIYDR
ncbi:multicopper oxidase family protein [Thermogemmatispora carboxidivorans]|uniref:multicopper oxidase family protein n=1 Tax=Thermogemmatispora carboxidivorans TaxID=1382306 RepID=UPI0006993A4C|nr:multicopper oxidase domain-containing protein [Thermogemmatispora carboxidivorans]